MTELGAAEIQAIIPHRWPFLLVDRVVELEAGSRAVGLKRVTDKDFFLQGHFPGRPIMPAVLIVEALAQVGAVALMSEPDNQGKLGLFLGIDGFRFRRIVVPGDTLRLEVALGRMRGNFGKGTGRAEVDGQLVAEGEITFMLADPQHLDGEGPGEIESGPPA